MGKHRVPRPTKFDRYSDGQLFAFELDERFRELKFIWADFEDAVADGMLGMAHAQAVALAIHARDCANCLSTAPGGVVGVID